MRNERVEDARGCERKNKLEKNRRDELREGKPALGDSSASTRYYVAAETNLYKRKTERRH